MDMNKLNDIAIINRNTENPPLCICETICAALKKSYQNRIYLAKKSYQNRIYLAQIVSLQ